MKKLLLLVSLFSCFLSAYSRTCISQGTGNWENSSSWLCAGVASTPTSADTIIIQGGHTVTITSVVEITGSPVRLVVNGNLNFNTGKKLKLPCGSTIEIGPGGQITPGGGGGSSNYIEICGTEVWSAGDGTMSGPSYCDGVGCGSVLPIELLSFTATQEKNLVILKWTTASEVNNDFFTIEKTIDGIVFKDVKRVEGAGNSSQSINYATEDKAPVNGLNYYRLRQTDFDKKFTYSDLIGIEVEMDIQELNVYPNPLKKGQKLNIVLNGKNDKDILVVLIDLLGNEFYSKVLVLEQGQITIVMDPSQKLPPGVYMVTGSSNNLLFSKRIVVQ